MDYRNTNAFTVVTVVRYENFPFRVLATTQELKLWKLVLFSQPTTREQSVWCRNKYLCGLLIQKCTPGSEKYGAVLICSVKRRKAKVLSGDTSPHRRGRDQRNYPSDRSLSDDFCQLIVAIETIHLYSCWGNGLKNGVFAQ